MRVIAILAVYNEARVLAASLDNVVRQGVEFYVIDNESTDDTVAIAERYRDRGLVGIERFPRAGIYEWEKILRRKEELAQTLDADWFIHADADEIRLPPTPDESLVSALERADRSHFNAVNFFEFTFTPTRELPAHEHPRFQETMRHYYPFSPAFPWRMNAWKNQPDRVDLASSGGHVVRFDRLRASPEMYKMKHYLYLSVPHAIEKYIERTFALHEIERGWHGWRTKIAAQAIDLPSQREMRQYTSDAALDPTDPRIRHHLQDLHEAWEARARREGAA